MLTHDPFVHAGSARLSETLVRLLELLVRSSDSGAEAETEAEQRF